MRKFLYALGGILLAVGFGILGRDGRAARRAEAQRDALLATGANEHKKKAEQLAVKAEKQKAAAKEAADATKARLEKLSEKDPDMDDLLSAWESERVRQQSG